LQNIVNITVGTAFASAVLYLLQEESGGFHFLGASSIGKTTLLQVASSVWGGPERLQRWRATSKGLEAIATLHNDSLLCLDEIGQVDFKEIGEIAYMLANGSGKGRCFRDGSVRKKSTWRILFLSTDESGLADHLEQGGKKIKVGQEVRLVDLPADAGSNSGIFEALHHFESGAALSRHLNEMTKHYYGTAIRQYLHNLTNNVETARRFIQNQRAEFLKANTAYTADGQVYRVASRFALIAAAAAELATEFGIAAWQRGAAFHAVGKCFNDWLIQRGGTGPKESALALAQVRYFFEVHGESRFSPWDKNSIEQKTFNRAGFRRGSDFFVFPEVFKQDICVGMNPRFVAKLCLERGWLIGDSKGHALTSHRLPDTGKTRRVYQFCDKLFSDEII
jgi:putative DNA primase/helicase